MTRRTPALALLTAATALALVACSHPAGSGSASSNRSMPATAGIGANADDTNVSPPDDTSGQNGGNGNGTGGGNGNGNGGGHASPSPSRSTATGPQIVSFTATGAQCQVTPQPGAPYGQPGQVNVGWKLANADGVSLSIDGGLWKSYDGAQGSDTLPFACPAAAGKSNTHKYTLTIKNTGVTKTISASAKTNP
jgi:hypothetical protein